VTTLVFHDLPEARIGDLHRVATRYITGKDKAEEQICREQMTDIPWGEEIRALFHAFETRADDIWIIAKDADYLEQAFQAKIYLEQGHTVAQTRITNVGNALRTRSAKQVRADMQTKNSTDRWQWLMHLPHER
jgi:putative hydrolase of HD superfamily